MSIISEARELREQFVKLREMANDEVAVQVPKLYPIWKAEMPFKTGDRVLYNDVLYKVLQDHTSQETWTPVDASSLFAKVLIPDENIIPDWEQPESTNPYMTGDKVIYNEMTWISIVDNNVWAPGSYGWEKV